MQEIKDFIRKVNYHETDKMGITHHSNYIKWMEEARVDFLEQIGWGYAKLESEGIVSPVIGVECQYKRPTTFGDPVCIHVPVEEFGRIELVIGYTMTKEPTGEIVLTGKTHHCFLSDTGRPIALKRQFPALDACLRSFVTSKET